MPHDLGIIGAGNMAEAIARGVIRSALLRPDQIVAADVGPSGGSCSPSSSASSAVESNADAARYARTCCSASSRSRWPPRWRRLPEEIAPDARWSSPSPPGLRPSSSSGTWAATVNARRVVRDDAEHADAAGRGDDRGRAGHLRDAGRRRTRRHCFESAGAVIEVTESLIDAVTASERLGPGVLLLPRRADDRRRRADGLHAASRRGRWWRSTALGAAKMLDESPTRRRSCAARSPARRHHRGRDPAHGGSARARGRDACRDAAESRGQVAAQVGRCASDLPVADVVHRSCGSTPRKSVPEPIRTIGKDARSPMCNPRQNRNAPTGHSGCCWPASRWALLLSPWPAGAHFKTPRIRDRQYAAPCRPGCRGGGNGYSACCRSSRWRPGGSLCCWGSDHPLRRDLLARRHHRPGRAGMGLTSSSPRLDPTPHADLPRPVVLRSASPRRQVHPRQLPVQREEGVRSQIQDGGWKIEG